MSVAGSIDGEPEPWPGRRVFWLAAAAAIVGALVLFAVDPSTSGIYPPCPFHLVTGLHCPGCGTTRGLHALLHGHLLAAADANVLMVLSIPVVGYAWLSHLWRVLGRKPWPALPATRWTLWGFLAVVTVYWVVRNLPCYPFTVLAP